MVNLYVQRSGGQSLIHSAISSVLYPGEGPVVERGENTFKRMLQLLAMLPSGIVAVICAMTTMSCRKICYEVHHVLLIHNWGQTFKAGWDGCALQNAPTKGTCIRCMSGHPHARSDMSVLPAHPVPSSFGNLALRV